MDDPINYYFITYKREHNTLFWIFTILMIITFLAVIALIIALIITIIIRIKGNRPKIFSKKNQIKQLESENKKYQKDIITLTGYKKLTKKEKFNKYGKSSHQQLDDPIYSKQFESLKEIQNKINFFNKQIQKNVVKINTLRS